MEGPGSLRPSQIPASLARAFDEGDGGRRHRSQASACDLSHGALASACDPEAGVKKMAEGGTDSDQVLLRAFEAPGQHAGNSQKNDVFFFFHTLFCTVIFLL